MTPDTLPHLARLLDYEIRCAKRYRRFISLILLSGPDTTESIAEVLGTTLRDSDELLALERGAVVILTETAPEAAEKALERIQSAVGSGKLQCSVICFPRDGHTTQTLMELCSTKLNPDPTADTPADAPYEGGRAALDTIDDENGRGAGIRYVDSREGYW